MTSRQLSGCGVHALQVLLLLLLLLLLPLRVTPGRERLESNRGVEGDLNTRLNLTRGGHDFTGLKSSWRGSRRGGCGVQDTWRKPRRAQKKKKKKDESPLPCSRLAAESLVQGSRATPLTFGRLSEESWSDKLGKSLELGDMCESACQPPHAAMGVAPTCGVPGGARGKTNDFQVKVN